MAWSKGVFTSLYGLLHGFDGGVILILIAEYTAKTSERRDALHVRKAKDVARSLMQTSQVALCFIPGAVDNEVPGKVVQRRDRVRMIVAQLVCKFAVHSAKCVRIKARLGKLLPSSCRHPGDSHSDRVVEAENIPCHLQS